MNNDIIYFSVNNWFAGRDYPDTPKFNEWLGNDGNQKFADDDWCKQNKLCVYCAVIDMSLNYTVSAPREWVEENCPELLTDKEYTYSTIILKPSKNKFAWLKKLLYIKEYKTLEYKKKYSDFVYTPEEGKAIPNHDNWYIPFREYCEENFGVEYYEETEEDEETIV